MDAHREVGDGEQDEGVDEPLGDAPGEEPQQPGGGDGQGGEDCRPRLVLDAVVRDGEGEE